MPLEASEAVVGSSPSRIDEMMDGRADSHAVAPQGQHHIHLVAAFLHAFIESAQPDSERGNGVAQQHAGQGHHQLGRIPWVWAHDEFGDQRQHEQHRDDQAQEDRSGKAFGDAVRAGYHDLHRRDQHDRHQSEHHPHAVRTNHIADDESHGAQLHEGAARRPHQGPADAHVHEFADDGRRGHHAQRQNKTTGVDVVGAVHGRASLSCVRSVSRPASSISVRVA